MGNLLKSAKLDGFFTNHSLRRTGTTRLFRAGVDKKIVKEYTGHVSDAVDKYQITSEAQNEEVCKILGGESKAKCNETAMDCVEQIDRKSACNNSIKPAATSGGPQSNGSNMKTSITVQKDEEVVNLLTSLMRARGKGKAKITIELDFSE